MRPAGSKWLGRRLLRHDHGGHEIREAHREHVRGLRTVLAGRPRMGRSGRRNRARVPGSLSGNAVETEAVLLAWQRIWQRRGEGSLRVLMQWQRVRAGASLALVALVPTFTACYQYVPIATATPPVGQLVELQVTDRGRVGLGDRF